MQVHNTYEATLAIYESGLEPHRLQLGHTLNPLFTENDARIILLFWINFCSMGVGMTEPVEHWIRRAGQKCKELGYHELGMQLCKHAIHEANHHLLMIADTKKLINKWNKFYIPKLEASVILNNPIRKSVIEYQNLHMNYIEGKNPYCQIAIEYEIENISVIYGPKVLNHTFKLLGEDIKESLSFLDEHVRIDAAHTHFNRKVISNFIASHPEALSELINAGGKALKTYGDFLKDCYQQAKNF